MERNPEGDFVLFDELPREQRRYEIARDVMAALWPTVSALPSLDEVAAEAVVVADALLAALEETER